MAALAATATTKGQGKGGRGTRIILVHAVRWFLVFSAGIFIWSVIRTNQKASMAMMCSKALMMPLPFDVAIDGSAAAGQENNHQNNKPDNPTQRGRGLSASSSESMFRNYDDDNNNNGTTNANNQNEGGRRTGGAALDAAVAALKPGGVGSLYVNTTKRPFFICTQPKTGCTTWAAFFLYANLGLLLNATDVKNNPGMIHQHTPKLAGYSSAASLRMARVFYSTPDRFVVARNPYVRFVSSYQDWVRRNGVMKGNYQFRVPFPQFLDIYRARNFGNYSVVYSHIDPVSHLCGYNNKHAVDTAAAIGESLYTAVLRVEEQALWYDGLVERHMPDEMEQFVQSGNMVFRSGIDRESRVADYLPQIAGLQPWPRELVDVKHYRNSENKLRQYYTSPDLVQQVTELFMDDLRNFQYPLWNGNFRSFRLV